MNDKTQHESKLYWDTAGSEKEKGMAITGLVAQILLQVELL